MSDVQAIPHDIFTNPTNPPTPVDRRDYQTYEEGKVCLAWIRKPGLPPPPEKKQVAGKTVIATPDASGGYFIPAGPDTPNEHYCGFWAKRDDTVNVKELLRRVDEGMTLYPPGLPLDDEDDEEDPEEKVRVEKRVDRTSNAVKARGSMKAVGVLALLMVLPMVMAWA